MYKIDPNFKPFRMPLLTELIEMYKGGHIDFEYLMNVAHEYDVLMDDTKFLCAMGTPIKSSKDFQRSQKACLEEVSKSIFRVEEVSKTGLLMSNSDSYTFDRKQAKEIAKKVAIRPLYLSKELD